MTYIIISLIVYILVMSLFSYIGYKKTKTDSDYLLAGRDMHPVVMALSYGATFVSTSAIVGFGGAAGQFGMGLLWLTVLNIIVGVYIAFVLFGKRTREIGCRLGSNTMPELFARRFDSKFIQGYAGILIFLFMPVYASAVLKGIIDFVSKYTGAGFDAVLLISGILVAVFVITGGLKGIMYADAFQGAIMFAGMAYLIIYTYSMLGGVTNAHVALSELISKPGIAEQVEKLVQGGFTGWTSMPKTGSPLWWNIISTLVAGVGIGVLAQPQLSVKFMTVKSGRELNRAVLSGGIFILFMTGVAFTVGALSNVAFYNAAGQVSVIAAGSNDGIIPAFIKTFLPGWFGGIFLVVLLAAGISTVNALIHTMGTALGSDFLKQSLGLKAGTIALTRIAMIIGLVISMLLAWLSSKLDVSMAIIAIGTSMFYGLCAAAFLPSYIAALYIKSFPKGAAVASILTGSAASLFWLFFVQEKTSGSLQICKLLFGTTSIVKDTALSTLSMVDAIVVSLPLSALAALIAWAVIGNTKNEEEASLAAAD
ncbi:MAG: sodium:solute symporter family protein [Oscillospiraceae bacterium]|nr:sodium:solute symporter family protein [Oscillospiraceae bacterium]